MIQNFLNIFAKKTEPIDTSFCTLSEELLVEFSKHRSIEVKKKKTDTGWLYICNCIYRKKRKVYIHTRSNSGVIHLKFSHLPRVRKYILNPVISVICESINYLDILNSTKSPCLTLT